MKDYLEINKESWNNRLESHLKSDFYNLEGFVQGASSLNQIELDLLGDIGGLRILHLQCHFGQDTISLSRLGAETVGVDLSDQSIQKARELAKDTGSTAQFICCDIYDLPNHLNEQFDIVYTSYGTISWLPDLDKWAGVISKFLKPGGKFVFVEFHPLVWMFDDDMNKVGYNYFNEQPIIEEEEGTYADRSAEIKQKYVCWNHSLSEVFTSLMAQGLSIGQFQEYDYSPYAFVNHSVEVEPGKYRITPFEDKVPLVYSIVVTKR
ncbi:MAG: SAM-dependent methyltransferase [Crocinitomicaceae bacterium]|nr:SAM-dependent methyltransferase [Crocinitomicaceae bacterium]|tara:strand:- start:1864 stop:2655 length:792 start_codon:yes stop_codon:yes gene_type:complete